MSAAAGVAAGIARLCDNRRHHKIQLSGPPVIVASCVVSRLADRRRCCKRSDKLERNCLGEKFCLDTVAVAQAGV